MPAEQVDELRRTVEGGGAESVSAYVSDAVRDRLTRDKALEDFDAYFGELPDETLT